MKTRKEREAQLQRLAATKQGKFELADMAKHCLGIRKGESLPLTTLLIHVILTHEYPPGAEKEARSK